MLRRPGDAGLGRPWSLPHRGEGVVLLTQNGQRVGVAERRLEWVARSGAVVQGVRASKERRRRADGMVAVST